MLVNAIPPELLQESAVLDAVERLGRVSGGKRRHQPVVDVVSQTSGNVEHRRLRGVPGSETMLVVGEYMVRLEVGHQL